MGELIQVAAQATQELAERAFAGLGCEDYGIVMLQGATSWGAHESGNIVLPTANGSLTLPIAYDERGGPYVTDEAIREQPGFLLSLTDDKDYIACAWARVTPDSPLVGVGVDLTDTARFVQAQERKHDLTRLLFTASERALAPLIDADNLHLAHATLFASKEAGFKATAAPLRRWYEEHDRELRFEVRHFVTPEPGLVEGTGRNGAAQAAMDAMGIDRVEVYHTEACGRALVVAVALAAQL